MDVTWDTAKNQKNIDKRHLPLSLGGLVLDDEMRIERHDKEHSTPEQDRWQTIGMAGKVLFMVYTEEKRLYYGERDLQASGWYRVNPGRTGHAGGSGETPN